MKLSRIRGPGPLSLVEDEGNNKNLVETELRIFQNSDIKDVYKGMLLLEYL